MKAMVLNEIREIKIPGKNAGENLAAPGEGPLKLTDLPVPAPGHREVLIKVLVM